MIRAAILALAFLASACTVADPYYCESDSDCAVDAGEACAVEVYTCVVVPDGSPDAPDAPEGDAGECSTYLDCGDNEACHNGVCIPLPTLP